MLLRTLFSIAILSGWSWSALAEHPIGSLTDNPCHYLDDGYGYNIDPDSAVFDCELTENISGTPELRLCLTTALNLDGDKLGYAGYIAQHPTTDEYFTSAWVAGAQDTSIRGDRLDFEVRTGSDFTNGRFHSRRFTLNTATLELEVFSKSQGFIGWFARWKKTGSYTCQVD